MKIHLKLIFLPIITVLLFGCSSGPELNLSSAEGGYNYGERLEKNQRFEEAISQFTEVRNKFPYSNFATLSELKIADIQFQRETFIEAEAAYRLFKDLHPTHEKIDYVTFQLGMSLFNQLPSSIDRDLSLANKAIRYFEEVVTSFPKSQYFGQAMEKKNEALKKLAEKELYIANYYFIREHYDSALGRYEDLMKKFPNLGLNAEALKGATISAFKTSKANVAQRYFKILEKNYPQSVEFKAAQKELNK